MILIIKGSYRMPVYPETSDNVFTIFYYATTRDSGEKNIASSIDFVYDVKFSLLFRQKKSKQDEFKPSLRDFRILSFLCAVAAKRNKKAPENSAIYNNTPFFSRTCVGLIKRGA